MYIFWCEQKGRQRPSKKGNQRIGTLPVNISILAHNFLSSLIQCRLFDSWYIVLKNLLCIDIFTKHIYLFSPAVESRIFTTAIPQLIAVIYPQYLALYVKDEVREKRKAIRTFVQHPLMFCPYCCYFASFM